MRKVQLNTVPGYEDARPYYWIQDDGQLWSDFTQKYLSLSKHYNSQELRDQWLRGELKKEPYYVMYVGIYRGSKNHPDAIPIHRIVASAFIPNPDHLPEVNHIDKNTSNNNYTNLEWIEKIDNIKLGLSKPVWQCDKTTHKRIKKYNSLADAEKDGFDRPNIIAVCKGRRKSAQNYFWEYDN